MNLRNVFLILTLVFGLVVGVVGYFKYSSPSANGPSGIPEGMIIAAAHPIETGALITPDAIMFAKGPADAVSGTYFDRDVADNATDQPSLDKQSQSEVLGAVARHSYDVGQPILRESVVKPGDSGFLAAVLRPGMRAITIGVTAVSGAAGLVYPGDRVDLILSQNFAGELGTQHHSVAELIAQDVRVLAIDQQLQAQATKGGKLAQTVTLESSPTQASDINLAKNLGELTLTIRSIQPGSATAAADEAAPVWAEDVSPALRAVEATAPSRQAQPPQIIIIRGDESSTSTVATAPPPNPALGMGGKPTEPVTQPIGQ